MKPILCLDFDGVIHSYSSGWKGATVIPDPPVHGALEFIVHALQRFRVCVLSSRSHRWGGRRAMRRWMLEHLVDLALHGYENTPAWWRQRIMETAFADPWVDEVRWAAVRLVREIGWPLFKPSATVTIDDRALTFTGQWPSMDELSAFRPWHYRRLR